jgi:hypothetical protein
VPVTGDPDRVVREIGPRELGKSSREMVSEVGSACRLEREYLARVQRPLIYRLRLTGAELFARDRASFDRFAGLREREVRATQLAEYFGGDARKSVSDWTHAVKERVKRAIVDPDSRSRVPLPDRPDTSQAPREV